MTAIALDHVVVRWISVSEMENNVYLITERDTGTQVLIDAAADPDAIADLIAAGSADARAAAHLRAIITTHQHWDHIRALPALAEAHPQAETIAGTEDAGPITEAQGVKIGRTVEHLETVDLDGISLEVIGLRGHTPGSRAFVLRDANETLLFSGDSLFPGGPGKTWSSADFTSLMDDLEERVFSRLPDETRVLPGHGAATTLGAERPQLGQWRSRGW
ncbi:glyoxylase-like metal-dependent hydrolase (beta-lactamase superfamily II) [Brevibacterium sanguinis]|uniref:Glyoxylase-like metal-dependent hydrolase (Beta-lactamase superfamily II) n=2 Tax=Brevibacterium TaxID=1696 RepID=A0A366IMW3_9MICO|nr:MULTISPECIES: MBL fold metallo-hydrolase [Brevibacterium]RBP66274.1 glyoxylase-like metal-dependent hydrolase (beta-lactamase superfamily II) [Brevibacterium sanguinis]RBP72925.1 glyoxylase-like metal-dependent hydrolase (beta-lactamase superfamily II) [Brevibacterium celere]